MPARKRVIVTCDWCGKTIEKWPSIIKRHNFCSRQCVADFSNKKKNPDGYMNFRDGTKMGERLARLNRELNPTRMTIETRRKIRQARLEHRDVVTYKKLLGAHEHRVVAEQILGRPLTDDEVVHHLDGDILNNGPENLYVFTSQAEHAVYHARLNAFFKKRGDAQ